MSNQGDMITRLKGLVALMKTDALADKATIIKLHGKLLKNKRGVQLNHC